MQLTSVYKFQSLSGFVPWRSRWILKWHGCTRRMKILLDSILSYCFPRIADSLCLCRHVSIFVGVCQHVLTFINLSLRVIQTSACVNIYRPVLTDVNMQRHLSTCKKRTNSFVEPKIYYSNVIGQHSTSSISA